MVASKSSIIFAAVAFGAASTYAFPTTFNRQLVRRAVPQESTFVAAAAAGRSNSTSGDASSDIAVAAVSSTSEKAKPNRYQNQHKDEGYESGEEDHKDEGHHGHHHHHHHDGKGHGHHHHDKGHHGHHCKLQEEQIFEVGFDEGFGAGYQAALSTMDADLWHSHGHHHHHHGHDGHHHHHHHGHHPHGEEPAENAKVNETVTIQTEAEIQPSAQHWRRDLAHGLGLKDEFFARRAYYEGDDYMY